MNLGLNVGLGFFLSSGTVGAAMEAWIAGVPSIAFSVGVPDNDRAWKREAVGDPAHPLWERAARLSADVVRDVREVGFPAAADLLSVNFPVTADLGTPRVVAELAAVGYERLFRERKDGVFVHDFSGVLSNESAVGAATDVAALRAGKVAITPVRLAHSAPIPPALRARLERA